MENDKNNPVAIFALAMTVFTTGSFLLVVQTGMSGRKPETVHYPYSFQGAKAAASDYAGDFERGTKVIKAKSDHFMASFFGGPAPADSAPADPAAGQIETANREAPRENDAEGDSFQKYFKDNYTDSQGNAADSGDRQWQEMDLGGGEPAADAGMGASLSAAAAKGDFSKSPRKETAAAPAGRKEAGQPPRGVFAEPAPAKERKAAPRLYAALQGNDAPAAGPGDQQPATLRNSAGYSGGKPQKGGSVSGMPGQRAGASLDGASENMAAGAQSNYNSKMGASAKAVASGAASGGSAPAASGPQQVSAAGGATGSAAAKTGDTAKTTASETDTGTSRTYDSPDAAADDQDLVGSVVAERLNGTDSKYISSKVAIGAPDETLLKAGAVVGATDEKEISDPDPTSLDKLSAARVTELKTEMHVFMTQVEREKKYGRMTDLYRTSCTLTPDVCKAHDVSGSYLTMVTEKGAKLLFGLKYVNSKWHPYTIDFKRP